MTCVTPDKTPGRNASALQSIYSQRQTFGSRFCLKSQLGYIRNFNDPSLTLDQGDDVWTANPSEAQQYACFDVAVDKLKAISGLFPDLVPQEIHYDIAQQTWVQSQNTNARSGGIVP